MNIKEQAKNERYDEHAKKGKSEAGPPGPSLDQTAAAAAANIQRKTDRAACYCNFTVAAAPLFLYDSSSSCTSSPSA